MNVMIAKTAAEKALGISLPSRRDEEWKWTDLRARISQEYPREYHKARSEDVMRLLDTSPFSKLAKTRLAYVNGHWHDRKSQRNELRMQWVHGSTDVNDPIGILNRVSTSHYVLKFDSNVNDLVEIVHVGSAVSPSLCAFHYVVEIADGASATIAETFVGEGDYLVCPVVHYRLGKGARLDRLKLQNDSRAATHLSHVTYDLAEGARLNDVTINIGSALTRQNGNCNFRGENAEAKICGTYLIDGKQHVDTRLVIDHKVPHCVSRELFKCVMDDHARGIFQGKVIVRPDAQKTDGKQSSHALLLSETAEFDAKPELEIYADDVVCGHGTTCGDLNHDHLFYLRSRGIPEAEARSMLVQAFVAEAFETVENEAVRDALMGMVEARLSA
jgi:Fe-S cluster assembly protein SufD